MRVTILPSSQRTVIGVINYNGKDASELIALENTVGCDASSFMQHLQMVGDMSSRIKNAAFHASMNLAHDESGMANDLVCEMINQYMDAMGYGQQPYAIFKHTDRQHLHFHIVSTRVDVKTGKKISDSMEIVRSNQIVQRLIEQYGLGHEFNLKQSNGLGVVAHINDVVANVLKSRPYSFLIFKNQCEQNGVVVNKVAKGVVFYLKDESGGRQRAIRSSELPIFMRRPLGKVLKSNRYYREVVKGQIVTAVSLALSKANVVPMSEFRAVLRANGVFVRLDSNAGGVFGVSFMAGGFELKGSELGDLYSWPKLSARILIDTVRSKPIGTRRVVVAKATRGLFIGAAYGGSDEEGEEDEKRKEGLHNER